MNASDRDLPGTAAPGPRIVLISSVEDHASHVKEFMAFVESASGSLDSYPQRAYRLIRANTEGESKCMNAGCLLDLAYQLRAFDVTPVDLASGSPDAVASCVCVEAAYYCSRIRPSDCVVVLTQNPRVKEIIEEFKQRHEIKSNLQVVLLAAPAPPS